MSEYGIPYMGSKDKIIKSLAMNFPKADHFYDLFGGGFSVTHYMLKNKSHCYKHFHYNEIKSDIVELIKKAINGDYNYNKFKPEWISKDKFFKRLDDPYIKICWSFGNNQKAYMFSQQIEPYKKSMHMAIVFNEFDLLAKDVFGFDKWPSNVKTIKAKRLYLRQLIEFYRVKNKLPKVLHQFLPSKKLQQLKQLDQLKRLQQLERLQRLEQLKQLEQLQSLERLEQLERLHQLEKLNFSSKDYRDVKILPNSVVYCDIPYKDTASYGEFNHDQFFEWAATRDFPVYISEYNIDDPRFILVYDIYKRSMLKNNIKLIKIESEKLYWNGK